MASIPALETLGLIALGALVAVDQVSVAQLQIAHPLVAGTLAGAVAGRPLEGALVGALLGLLVAGHRPVGGVVAPDGGPAAVVAAAALARARGGADLPAQMPGGSLALALLAGLLLADLGRHTEMWTRERNLRLLRWAEMRATAGAVRAAVAGAVGLAALRGGLTVAIGLPLLGAGLRGLEGRGPAAGVVVALVAGLGLAAGERLLGSRRRLGVVLAMAAAGAAFFLGGQPFGGGP